MVNQYNMAIRLLKCFLFVTTTLNSQDDWTYLIWLANESTSNSDYSGWSGPTCSLINCNQTTIKSLCFSQTIGWLWDGYILQVSTGHRQHHILSLASQWFTMELASGVSTHGSGVVLCHMKSDSDLLGSLRYELWKIRELKRIKRDKEDWALGLDWSRPKMRRRQRRTRARLWIIWWFVVL